MLLYKLKKSIVFLIWKLKQKMYLTIIFKIPRGEYMPQ